MEQGYIKYKSIREKGFIPETKEFTLLNQARTTLHEMKLIGVYDNGIGFGNISIRFISNHFIISGSATGGKKKLKKGDYAFIKSIDIEKNEVNYIGQINASSESMSHGVIYETLPEVNCVIHIHNKQIFEFMLKNNYSKTPKNIEYGTVKFAQAIKVLIASLAPKYGLFVTEGHEEGVFVYGDSIQVAMDQVRQIYNNIRPNIISGR